MQATLNKIPKPQLIEFFKQALLYCYKAEVKIRKPEIWQQTECETKSALEVIEYLSLRFARAYSVYRDEIHTNEPTHWELSIDVARLNTDIEGKPIFPDGNNYFLYLKLRPELAERLFSEYGVEVDKNYYRIEQ